MFNQKTPSNAPDCKTGARMHSCCSFKRPEDRPHMPKNVPLTNTEFNALIVGATLVEVDSHGPKVYRLANGEYLKLFRRKRFFSSALLVPYSVRFYSNAAQLRSNDIPTIEPFALYQLEDTAWTAVHYRPLYGTTLKDLFTQDHSTAKKNLPLLIEFFHTLHRKGIYFRSLHLGNIVLTPENQLGLIDIADLAFHRSSLSKSKTKRNMAHFERYLRHEKLLKHFPYEELYAAVLDN
ncbi:MAG: toluene tolerance protein [Pseudomonas sp.]